MNSDPDERELILSTAYLTTDCRIVVKKSFGGAGSARFVIIIERKFDEEWKFSERLISGTYT